VKRQRRLAKEYLTAVSTTDRALEATFVRRFSECLANVGAPDAILLPTARARALAKLALVGLESVADAARGAREN
jgi:hypothetical protein